MNVPWRRALIYGAIGTVMIGVAIAFGVFLVRQGLDNADKISSIISMIVGVVSLLIGILSLLQAAGSSKWKAKNTAVLNVGDHQEVNVDSVQMSGGSKGTRKSRKQKG